MTATMYGDSILKFVLLEDGRYQANHEYETRFTERFGVALRNLAYFGAAVEKGLSVIRRDQEKGPGPGDWAVIEFGGNDCNYRWEEIAAAPEETHVCITPPERFVEKIKEAVAAVRAAGAKPILTSLPPIEPERYFNWICRKGLSKENILRWLGDVNHLYRWSELYSRILEKVAHSENLPLVDLRTPFLQGNIDRLICEDGIHPNREGQGLIYEAFCCFTERMFGKKKLEA